MKFSFELGDVDRTNVDFDRNWFSGRMTVTVNGESTTLASPGDLCTHFSFRLTRNWQFRVGEDEVVVEKIRPLFFAGFRPHRYRVYVNGSLEAEHCGF